MATSSQDETSRCQLSHLEAALALFVSHWDSSGYFSLRWRTTPNRPTLAYEQAMDGGEHVRPRTTPAGAFERAREYLRTGKRIDMVELAADLDVARATLYRWTGDRERLLADTVWAEAHAIADAHLKRHRRRSRLARIRAVCVDLPGLLRPQRRRQRVPRPRARAGLELLTRVNGASVPGWSRGPATSSRARSTPATTAPRRIRRCSPTASSRSESASCTTAATRT